MESFPNPLHLFYISIWWRAHRKSICKEAKLRFAPRQELPFEAFYLYSKLYNGHKWVFCRLSCFSLGRKSHQHCRLFLFKCQNTDFWTNMQWWAGPASLFDMLAEGAFGLEAGKCVSRYQSNNISPLLLPMTVSCSLPQSLGSLFFRLRCGRKECPYICNLITVSGFFEKAKQKKQTNGSASDGLSPCTYSPIRYLLPWWKINQSLFFIFSVSNVHNVAVLPRPGSCDLADLSHRTTWTPPCPSACLTDQ